MANGTPAFAAKDRINHPTYGLGTIVEVNTHHTTILFDEAGSRKFVTAMVKLVASDTAAPAKAVRRKKKVAARSS